MYERRCWWWLLLLLLSFGGVFLGAKANFFLSFQRNNNNNNNKNQSRKQATTTSCTHFLYLVIDSSMESTTAKSTETTNDENRRRMEIAERSYWYMIGRGVLFLVVLAAFYLGHKYEGSGENPTLLTAEDEQFYKQVAIDYSFPPETWDHLAQVQLMYVLCAKEMLKMQNEATAGIHISHLYSNVYNHVKRSFMEYNRHHVSQLNQQYHETIAQLWTHLVLSAFIDYLQKEREEISFDHFIKQFPHLKTFERTTGEYYRKETLDSEEAKNNFIKPDLKPFPLSFVTE
jgi:hypothetical protein